jgi:hypothetical protein
MSVDEWTSEHSVAWPVGFSGGVSWKISTPKYSVGEREGHGKLSVFIKVAEVGLSTLRLSHGD